MTTDDVIKELNDLLHDHIVVMQAAFIEWKRGKGAEAAMLWIANTLDGPGHIPGKDVPYANDAQAYMSANRSHPMPKCACGRPSHIGWMKQGFCSEEHYRSARAASLN